VAAIASDSQVDQRALTWDDVRSAAQRLAVRIGCNGNGSGPSVYGVPRGGSIVAALLAGYGARPIDSLERGCVVVDDLVDSGSTRARYEFFDFDALYRKEGAPYEAAPGAIDIGSKWVEFPWERGGDEGPADDSVIRLIQWIGEDPQRPGLLDTPRRVTAALKEMTRGYAVDVGALVRVFDEGQVDEMIVLRGIRFVSLCEHHLLPFEGEAVVGYVPAEGRIIGVSKLARIVEAFAARLQVQERLTFQVADTLLSSALRPLGAGAVITAEHACMRCRGVRQRGSTMVTSAMLGVLREPAPLAEFMSLAGIRGG
jgi:GTP cyclohydrolase I